MAENEDPIIALVGRLRELNAREAGGKPFRYMAGAYKEAADALISLYWERHHLRDALAPFANIPPVTLSEGDQRPLYAAHYWCVIGSPDKTHFTREDLARARAALNKEPPCQET